MNNATVLAPKQMEVGRNFSRTVFEAGVLDEKTKQLITSAVAQVAQCTNLGPY